MVTAGMKLKTLASSKENYDKLRQNIKKQSYHFADKGPHSQINVWMWELVHREGWMPKNWSFQIVLEKALESPLDGKEIKPFNPKGNQSWIFIVRTNAEAEALIFWPPDVKRWFTAKDPDARKDWSQKEKEAAEDEMVR